MNGDLKAIFFNLDEFAFQVLLWPDTDQERTIVALYHEDLSPNPLASASLGPAHLSGARPALTADPMDLADVAVGTPLRVLPQQGLLGTPGGDFAAALEPRPDGSGLALLMLRRAE